MMTMAYLIMAASVMTTLPKASSCLSRLSELLELRPAVSDGGLITAAAPAKTEPVLVFDHVTFAYEGAEEPVISDLSFTLTSGQTTAVIGSTGSGKSTLADLILRLHDLQSGQIRLYGTALPSILSKRCAITSAVYRRKRFCSAAPLPRIFAWDKRTRRKTSYGRR